MESASAAPAPESKPPTGTGDSTEQKGPQE